MGCWNETCGITQLPILSGDPVALILLTYVGKQTGGAGYCGSNTVWSPRALPIFGVYNDYGSIEEIKEGWNTEFILKEFQTDMIEKDLGNNTVHDVAIKKLDLNVENLLQYITKNRLEVKKPYISKEGEYPNQSIGWMMVHFDVYKHLSEKIIVRWGKAGDQDKIKSDVLEFYQGIKTIFKQNLEGFEKNHEYMNTSELSESSKQNIVWCDIEMNAQYELYDVLDRDNLFLTKSFLNSGSSGLDYYGVGVGIKNYAEILKDFILDDLPVDNIQVKQFFGELACFTVFDNNIDILRKSYSPQNGRGSQDQNFDELSSLNRVVDTIIEKNKAKYEEDEEDEEDEESNEIQDNTP